MEDCNTYSDNGVFINCDWCKKPLDHADPETITVCPHCKKLLRGAGMSDYDIYRARTEDPDNVTV